MAAQVKFIIGRSGSGKTRAVYERIRENERAGKRSLLIVPDRATFETERELSAYLGKGMLFASVLSFTRLARKLLDEAGVRTHFLSPQGRQMLVRRVLDESAGELSVFSRVGSKRGFAAECDEIILKCKRYSITPEQLSSAEGLPAQLSGKLKDFALVYDRTLKRMEREYIDGEDLVNKLVDVLPSSSVRGVDVFIDAPDMMNAQSFRIIEALFACAASVTLTFRADPDPSADASLFEPDRLSYERLAALAAGCGCTVRTLELRGNRRHGDGALALLERNLFAFPFGKSDAEVKNIEVHSSIDRRHEVREAAERIMKAVREEKLRFCDIAVVVGDPSAYACTVRRCFSEYGIPLFMDGGRSVSAHPVSELIIGALRTVMNNFRGEDYIRVLKSGLSGISDEDAEKLENHILRFGLSGKRLSEPEPSVKKHDDIKDFEAIEASRTAVSEKLTALREKLRAARSATARSAAVYDYLVSVSAAEAIRKNCEELAADEATKLYADESAQAFDTVISLLDQVHVILSGEAVGLERFISVIEEGLAAYEINVIPTLLDQVLVGDVNSIHLGNVRLLLVLGTNEGVIPHHRDDNSVINDRELTLMRAAGLNAWDSSESMNKAEDLRLYSLITKPTDGLYVSFCEKLGEQSAAPSRITNRILRVFPNCLRTANGGKPASAAAAAFADLAEGLRSFVDTGEAPSSLASLYACFAADAESAKPLETVKRCLLGSDPAHNIGEEAAAGIYGKDLRGSPTMLEVYNQCPFRHLMQFGVKLKERDQHVERAVDHGTLIHDALDRYFKYLIAEKPDFDSIERTDVKAKMDEFVPGLLAEHNYGLLTETAMMRAEMERLSEELCNIAFVIVQQFRNSGFRPYRSELEFGKEKSEIPALELTGPNGIVFRINGVVDRVDTYDSGEKSYYRIVDYKTGEIRFDYTELANGLRLQLPLYAAAVQASISAAKKLDPSGLYYMHVTDLNAVSGNEDADNKALIGEMKLVGPSYADGEVLAASGDFSKGYSVVIRGLQLSGKAGGFISRSSPLISGEEMAGTLEYAKKIGEKTLGAIMSGRAEISPSKFKNHTACEKCAYQSVCRFDTSSGSKYRRIRTVAPDDFYGWKQDNKAQDNKTQDSKAQGDQS